MRASILVAGSLNMDFVATVATLPLPGQTLTGNTFDLIPGGKGANQACAAGRLAGGGAGGGAGGVVGGGAGGEAVRGEAAGRDGVRVCMAGRVGEDPFGEQLTSSLAAAGVDVGAVERVGGVSTGAAMINVGGDGQNTIVVIPGANHRFLPEHAEGLRGRLRESAWLLVQLESPLETVEALLRAARQEGTRSMLDPAPARALSRELLSLVDVITPNESEACLLLGRAAARVGMDDAPEMARAVRALGPRAVVLKLGDAGCYYAGPEGEWVSPAFEVQAVDATAAGDTFNAGLAVALTEAMAVPEALRFANAAAAVSVTRKGAQTSAPARVEVEAFLAVRRG